MGSVVQNFEDYLPCLVCFRKLNQFLVCKFENLLHGLRREVLLVSWPTKLSN